MTAEELLNEARHMRINPGTPKPLWQEELLDAMG
jgi:hypothetical protein